MRKHITILRSRPGDYDFPEAMEDRYGLVGPEFGKGVVPGYRRSFFRGNQTTRDLRLLAQSAGDGFVSASDDHQAYPEPELDFGEGCEESCEVFADTAPTPPTDTGG